MTIPIPIIEITNLTLASSGSHDQYDTKRLVVAAGDVIAIQAPKHNDARHLLRVMATLSSPEKGTYRFKNTLVDPKNYRQCLPVKRQIGYVADDSALISNRTIRENLLLFRYYEENDLTIDLAKEVSSLCDVADISMKLDLRPSALSDEEVLQAITIREMGKSPSVMLIDRPENFMDVTVDDGFFGYLKGMVHDNMALVFISNHNGVYALANRILMMMDQTIQSWDVDNKPEDE